MAGVEFAPEVREDFDRIFDHPAQLDAAHATERIMQIVQAIDVLVHSPLIGRLVLRGKREPVIGRKAHGSVALYQYVDAIDTVFVLAIHSQREAGYARS